MPARSCLAGIFMGATAVAAVPGRPHLPREHGVKPRTTDADRIRGIGNAYMPKLGAKWAAVVSDYTALRR